MAGVSEFASTPRASVPPTDARFSVSVRASPLVNRAPTMDVPSVVPTSRKKFVAAVAMPTSDAANSFCTMSTRISKFKPMPKPTMAKSAPMNATGVPDVMNVSAPTPTTRMPKLATMSFLYVPSLLTA